MSPDVIHAACEKLSSAADAVTLAVRVLAEAGIEEAAFEAQVIVARAFGVSRAAVVARIAPKPDSGQRAELCRILSGRADRAPLAYLLGVREFYGLRFVVSTATLIPRPETELLVDFALEVLTGNASPAPLLLDVGTGTGCIAISVLANVPSARAVASDISTEALQVAGQNAERLGFSNRIRFVAASALSGYRGRAQVILSNPPYIPSGEVCGLQPEVARFEPRTALDGGGDGLDVIRQLATDGAYLLGEGGWIAVECAMGQSQAAAGLLQSAGLSSVRTLKDLAGIERVVCARRD